MVHGLHSQHTAFWREVWQGLTSPRRAPPLPPPPPALPSVAAALAPAPAQAAAPSASPKPGSGLLHRRVAAAAQRATAPASAPATASTAEKLPPPLFSLWLPPSVETPLGSCEPSPLGSPILGPLLNPAPMPRRERKTSWLGASLGASCPSGWSLSATEGVGWPSLSATASAAADYRSGRANPRPGERRLSAWLSLLAALPEQPLWRLVRRLEQQGEHRAAADAAAAWLEARASALALASTSRTLAASVGAAACGASRHDGARQLAAWYVQRRWRRRRWRLARARRFPHSGG